MDSKTNDNLFLKPTSLMSFEKALHGSSTGITDYRDTSASLKWKQCHDLYCPASCQFKTFMNIL